MDLGFGVVAATVANVNRGKDVDPFSAVDFMPFHERPPEPEEDLSARIRKVFRPMMKD